MKFCLLKVIIFIFYFHNILTVKLKNPDEVLADSNGGNNGEFMRRNQPQEHVIIPLINSLEAEYTPNIDIKEFRKNLEKEIEKTNNRLKQNDDILNRQFNY